MKMDEFEAVCVVKNILKVSACDDILDELEVLIMAMATVIGMRLTSKMPDDAQKKTVDAVANKFRHHLKMMQDLKAECDASGLSVAEWQAKKLAEFAIRDAQAKK